MPTTKKRRTNTRRDKIARRKVDKQDDDDALVPLVGAAALNSPLLFIAITHRRSPLSPIYLSREKERH